MLSRNIESVRAQTSKDWEQLFIVDSKGDNGIPWANEQLSRFKSYIQGEWVFILDDDCRLTDFEFVSSVRDALVPRADMVMVRTRRPQLKPSLLPPDGKWGMENREKLEKHEGIHVNCLTYVVRRGLWLNTIHEFKGHSGARTFFQAVMRVKPHIVWLDRVMSTTQQLGRGKNFEECEPRWFDRIAKEYDLKKVVPIHQVWKATGR